MAIFNGLGGKIVRIVAVAITLALAVTACGGASATNKGNTLVIGIESEPDILDPQGAGGWVTYRITHQMFEGLVGEDLSKPSADAPTTALVPALAKSWDLSEDGMTYTFHLREGVKFHDGTDFNAEAVDYNIRRMWDKTSPQYNARAAGNTTFVWQHLSGITVVDDSTITLTLSQPFSPFLRLMAQGGSGSTGIISPTALKKYGKDIADHPVGTGPFKFEERVRGQRISLVRFDGYWGAKAKLDKVVFRPIPDASARVASIRSGETDIIAVPSPDSVAGLASDNYNVVEAAPPHVWYVMLNQHEAPMRDLKVRQAIMYAIDRESLSKDILKGTALPAYQMQAPANAAYQASAPTTYSFNLEKAKALMAESGFPNGFETTFETSVDGSGQMVPVQMAEFLKQNLEKIGITVNIKTYEWISYISHYNEGLADGVGMAQMSWGMSTPYWLSIVTDSALTAPNGPNTGYYNDPQLEAVIDKAVAATDPDEATKFWAEANSVAAAGLPFIPVVNDKSPYILSKSVKGFVLPSEEWYDLAGVSFSS